MKSAIVKPRIVTPRPKPATRDIVVRWIGFAALVALLAMATFPFASGQRPVAVQDSTQWSGTWHG
jgi:hypothetical protein